MRIGNFNQLNAHDTQSKNAVEGRSASKGTTKQNESGTVRKSDSEIRQLVEHLRGVTEDRNAVVEAVKERLSAGGYDSPATLEATAEAILNSHVTR